jgi:hypothetical protein
MTPGSSRVALLTQHFFRRFLDNDLISPNGDAHVGFSQTVAALLSPSLLVTSMVLFKYAMAWRPTWEDILRNSVPDGLLFVSLSMIVLGVAATITWDAFFLDARDRHILAVLPVSDRLLSAAKLAALGLFLAVFVAAVNVIPAVLVPALMVQGLRDSSGLRHFLPLTLAQIAAPVISNLLITPVAGIVDGKDIEKLVGPNSLLAPLLKRSPVTIMTASLFSPLQVIWSSKCCTKSVPIITAWSLPLASVMVSFTSALLLSKCLTVRVVWPTAPERFLNIAAFAAAGASARHRARVKKIFIGSSL